MGSELSRAYLETTGLFLEGAGVLAIVAGALVAVCAAGRGALRGQDGAELYELFRTRLAKSILIGVEFLIAADIVGTVIVEPTAESLGVLALIVVIRTFLSFSLEVEIEGRWPWQRHQNRHDD